LGWVYILRVVPIESVDRGGSRCAHIDTASMTEICHAGDPDAFYSVLLTQSRNGVCEGRVCVLCQENLCRTAAQQCFFQLLCANYNLSVSDSGQKVASCGHLTFMRIHTRIYYNHNFRNVNKFY